MAMPDILSADQADQFLMPDVIPPDQANQFLMPSTQAMPDVISGDQVDQFLMPQDSGTNWKQELAGIANDYLKAFSQAAALPYEAAELVSPGVSREDRYSMKHGMDFYDLLSSGLKKVGLNLDPTIEPTTPQTKVVGEIANWLPLSLLGGAPAIASGVAGGAVTGATKELGGGPIAQLAAGLIGSFGPSIGVKGINTAGAIKDLLTTSGKENIASKILQEAAGGTKAATEAAQLIEKAPSGTFTADLGLSDLLNTPGTKPATGIAQLEFDLGRRYPGQSLAKELEGLPGAVDRSTFLTNQADNAASKWAELGTDLSREAAGSEVRTGLLGQKAGQTKIKDALYEAWSAAAEGRPVPSEYLAPIKSEVSNLTTKYAGAGLPTPGAPTEKILGEIGALGERPMTVASAGGLLDRYGEPIQRIVQGDPNVTFDYLENIWKSANQRGRQLSNTDPASGMEIALVKGISSVIGDTVDTIMQAPEMAGGIGKEALNTWAKARKMSLQMAEKYKNGPIGEVLAKDMHGFKTADASVMNKVLSTEKGVKAFLEASNKNPELINIAKEQAANVLGKAYALGPKAYQRVMEKNWKAWQPLFKNEETTKIVDALNAAQRRTRTTALVSGPSKGQSITGQANVMEDIAAKLERGMKTLRTTATLGGAALGLVAAPGSAISALGVIGGAVGGAATGFAIKRSQVLTQNVEKSVAALLTKAMQDRSFAARLLQKATPDRTQNMLREITNATGLTAIRNIYNMPERKEPLKERQWINTMNTDDLMAALIEVESNNNPNAVSKKGAKGLAQLMDGTGEEIHRQLVKQNKISGPYEPFNKEQNVLIGRTYLEQLLDQFKDPQLALAAYNAGPTKLSKIISLTGNSYDVVKDHPMFPEETRKYVDKIMKKLT